MPADPRARALRAPLRPAPRCGAPRRAARRSAARGRRPDQAPPLSARLHRRAALGLAAVLALALVALGLAQSGPGRSILRDAGLSAPAEHFTALAFARPGDLPQEPAAGVPIPVSFRVANREEGPRAYAWRVVERAGGAGATLAAGRIDVERGAAATVRARVAPACAGRRTRVAVVLERPAREIGFWVACPGPGAPS